MSPSVQTPAVPPIGFSESEPLRHATPVRIQRSDRVGFEAQEAQLQRLLGVLQDRGGRDDLPSDVVEAVSDFVSARDADPMVTAVITHPHPTVADFSARWVLSGAAGREPIVRSLHLEATARITPDGGISAAMLRNLSPAKVRAYTAELLAPTSARPGSAAHAVARARRESVEAAPTPTLSSPKGQRRPGRPPLDDGLLQRVATAYLAEQGRGPGLYDRMVAHFPDRPITPTLRHWVRLARERGFLTPAERPGQRGSDPGPKYRSPEPNLTSMEIAGMNHGTGGQR